MPDKPAFAHRKQNLQEWSDTPSRYEGDVDAYLPRNPHFSTVSAGPASPVHKSTKGHRASGLSRSRQGELGPEHGVPSIPAVWTCNGHGPLRERPVSRGRDVDIPRSPAGAAGPTATVTSQASPVPATPYASDSASVCLLHPTPPFNPPYLRSSCYD